MTTSPKVAPSRVDDDRVGPSATRLLELVHDVSACEDLVSSAAAAARASREIFACDATVTVTRAGNLLARSGEEASLPASAPADAATASLVTMTSGPTDVTVELTLRRTEHASFDDAARALADRWIRTIVIDVDRRVRAADASSAFREQQKIVGAVSHDLRTPLQSVALGVDTLGLLVADSPLSVTSAGTVARMQRSVATMTRLLNELLEATRIDARAR